MSRGSKRRERSHPRALPILISAVLFLSGCGMLLYPTLSNWLNNRHQSELYVAYTDQVAELDDKDFVLRDGSRSWTMEMPRQNCKGPEIITTSLRIR